MLHKIMLICLTLLFQGCCTSAVNDNSEDENEKIELLNFIGCVVWETVEEEREKSQERKKRAEDNSRF